MVVTAAVNDEPWFVGKDVASALGYEKPTDAVRKHVDEEDKGVAKCDTPSGIQNMTVINESGLYSLIFGSKLPSASRFKQKNPADFGGFLRNFFLHHIINDVRKDFK